MTDLKINEPDIQHILDNPVVSAAQKVTGKKEGFSGWMTYVGFLMVVVAPMAFFIALLYEFVFVYFRNLFSDYLPYVYVYVFLGQILGILYAAILGWKTKYDFKGRCQLLWIAGALFVASVCVFLYSIMQPIDELGLIFVCAAFFCLISVVLLIWYKNYFRCKIQDGYKHVGLKVVFTFVLLVAIPVIVIFSPKTPFSGFMGDTL